MSTEKTLENSPRVMGQAPDGSDVLAITIRGGSLEASCMSWGASLQSLNHHAVPHSLVLGSADLQAWFEDFRYYGSVVGPVANRIAGGRFALNGNTFDTDRNENGVTTLHGGSQGFGERNWRLEEYSDSSCRFVLEHPDGLGGFPGNLQVSVIYALHESNTLVVRIEGKTDRTTYFNPAFHGYWNLDGKPSLKNHRLQIDAQTYLPVNEHMIPTGSPKPVQGTKFDYRSPRTPDDDLDHNFCLGSERVACRRVGSVSSEHVQLEIETTEPGLQVYSGGGIDTKPWKGHEGVPYTRNAGLAIEPQCWPDTPNQDGFPDAILQPGELYEQVTKFHIKVN